MSGPSKRLAQLGSQIKSGTNTPASEGRGLRYVVLGAGVVGLSTALELKRRLPAADVVVVPALAVDRGGVRLGRGGGYYDRALRHVRPDARLVALVFDDELVDALPVEPHDRRVTAVVTPSGGWLDLA